MENVLNYEQSTVSGSFRIDSNAVLPNGMQARKITSKTGVDIVFTGKDGEFGGVKFESDKILVIPVYFKEEHSIYFHLRFYEDKSNKPHEYTDIAMGVMPGFVVNIIFELKNLDLNTLFLRRTPGRLKNTSTGTPTTAEKLDTFIFHIPPSNTEQTVYAGAPYITDTMPECGIPKLPLVDKMGQWTIKDWKGKTKNEDELKSNYQKWVGEELLPMTENRSDYGGSKSKNYGAGGYFRAEQDKDAEMWYLIDPDGYPFYSIGVDCVGANINGPVDGIEGLFEELPEKEGIYKDAWGGGRRRANEFCFNRRNLITVFGEKWHETWQELTAKRLKHWGFNTIANWSEKGFGRKYNIPYVIETPFPKTETAIFRDFPDVFAPEYSASADECAKFLEEYKDDKFLIGYFLRNEPNWAFGAYNIAHMMLNSETDTYSRREFKTFIENKYNADISLLNEAWDIKFSGFADFYAPFTERLTPQAEEDTKEFTRKLIYQYIKIPSIACKKIDGNHMNLGMRWAWIASDDFYEGSEFIDVFSINCYQIYPNADDLGRISKLSGNKPVMIGEFHAGALDAGLPANALQGVTNQSERGNFYSYYMENGAKIPPLVGAHYFQYNDQPVLGRFDGENLNIGLVDVCGRPYYDMLDKVIETNGKIYKVRSGEIPPTNIRPETAIREGF